MSTTNQFHPDLLRPIEHVFESHPRNLDFAKLDPETGEFVPLNIRDQHAAVSEYKLHAKVPEDFVMQFETAKNLYLYAWFVYGFYPVCEHHALACLELSLRKRYDHEVPKEYRTRDGRLYLKGLLRYAIDRGHVKHDGFRRWHERAHVRASVRYEKEKREEMYAKGLKRIDLDYSEVTVTDTDRNWKYLSSLLDHLLGLRNHYAHGTSMLHNQVLGTLEVVSEIINQIYPAE